MTNPKVSTRPSDHSQLIGRGDSVKTDFCRGGEEASAVVPWTPGQAGAEGKQRDAAWVVLPRWSHQNAGVTSSRLAIQWSFTVLTYTAHDSQTSDYHANKYKEGPEINSIPLQQSHLSLGLILCWTGGGFWNNTYVSQPQDNWIGRIRESDSCPIRAVTCHGLSSWPATFVHLARSAHQAQTHPAGCPVLLSLHPCQWVQETEALTPFWEGVNDWQCRRGLYHLLPCALSTLSAGSDKPA